ncbi:putative methyltransferase-domain-containing protein [Powellomyces hirtus]|nr:putative methyltransferase-domain-containing protein [Powellomyces hirtus]
MTAANPPPSDEASLNTLVANYHQRTPPHSLSYPELSPPTQLHVLSQTHFSSLSAQYPPSPVYIRSFLKSLISATEAQGHEVCEELLVEYVGLTVGGGNSGINAYGEVTSSAPAYVSYPVAGRWMTLREEHAKISRGTTGLVTWEAALRFGEYLAAETGQDTLPGLDVGGKRVLELGAGTGFLGILSALLGAKSVRMTDVDPWVLSRLAENVGINCKSDNKVTSLSLLPCTPTVEVLDWESHADISLADADVLICADVVYDPSLIPPLVGVLHAFLTVESSWREGADVNNREAWVALTRRQEETLDKFMKAVKDAGITVTRIPLAHEGGIRVLFFHERGCGDVVLLRLSIP